MSVKFGIEVLQEENFAPLMGKRVALFTHPGAVNRQIVSSYRLLTKSLIVQTVALFSPEHGFSGSAADGVLVNSGIDARTGLPIHSLYGEHFRPTAVMLRDIDVIVCDIQDIGTRFYTFIWTLSHILEAAGEHGVEVMILDRPNPLGDRVYGLPIFQEMESLVGRYNIPIAHGMTVGELAQMMNQGWNKHPCKLRVIRSIGWRRNQNWAAIGRIWTPTSPAMPHFSTVQHYSGACLVEGTTLSEGRGTPLPFEIVGAPYIDSYALAEHLNALPFAAVRFRPHSFRPTSSKYAGEDCHGIQVHITHPESFHPFHVWLGVIREIRNLYPQEFQWLPPHGQSIHSTYHFDRLVGSSIVREAIDDGAELAEILQPEARFCRYFVEKRKEFLLYT